MAELTQEHKDRIEQWCAALEGGKYQQGRKRLRHAGRMCCLGVACDISNQGKWAGGIYSTKTGQSSSMEMPSAVSKYFGLAYGNPFLIDEQGEDESAADLNDSQGYTFPQIAAAIRCTYLTEAK